MSRGRSDFIGVMWRREGGSLHIEMRITRYLLLGIEMGRAFGISLHVGLRVVWLKPRKEKGAQ